MAVARSNAVLKVNRQRLLQRLDALAVFGVDPTGGWSRYSFSEEDLKARDLLTQWTTGLGMTARTDAAGNLIARLEGSDPDLPAVAVGSHLDTVKNGGKFDGVYGVVAGLEAINVLVEQKVSHRRPVELIVFAEEEGSGFGASLYGSKAMAGVADELFLGMADETGLTLGEAMQRVGCDPTLYRNAARDKTDLHAYLEAHIEQGLVLESENTAIGVVEGIVGFLWARLTVRGRPDHAGATPMDLRRDAVAGAAEIILAAEALALEAGKPLVSTTGKMSVKPNSINSIAGEVEISFDVRDIRQEKLDAYVAGLGERIDTVCRRRGLRYEYEDIAHADPVLLSGGMCEAVERAARQAGVSSRRMVSGAGHDAQLMARITDVGMIFVPSKDGISHSPDEWTEPEHLEQGAQVLCNALLELVH